MPLDVENVLVLSTAHITEDVAEQLADPESALSEGYFPRPNSEYGWFIPILNAEDPMNPPPECLKRCLDLAREMGCKWLLLDRDGRRTGALKTFEW